jgi:hypothetical protein
VQTAPVTEPTSPIDALIRWTQDRYGGTVSLAEPARSFGEGFDSAVQLVRLAGSRLPDPWRAAHEAAIQDWVADRGYPAPRVLHVFAPGELLDLPAQVMARAPGRTMLDELRTAPWRAKGRVHPPDRAARPAPRAG